MSSGSGNPVTGHQQQQQQALSLAAISAAVHQQHSAQQQQSQISAIASAIGGISISGASSAMLSNNPCGIAGLLGGGASAAAASSGSGTGVGGSGGASTVAPSINRTQVTGSTPATSNTVENEKIYQCINDLLSSETREAALMELSRKRESVADLAVMLWHTFGSIVALLQEIIAVYPTIHPPTLNAHQSNRVCNALALLQCVASHPETRGVFLEAHIPLFLYPFLNMNTSSKTRPFEYLRLTSLGVIGALVKSDEKEVINFLLKTEIIPLCLRIMESGAELSKTVATFILHKILLDETGLNYICQTYDRFSHVAMILAKMVIALSKDQSARLLKHVIRCYLRLSENSRAREALRQCLPDQLKNNTFMNCLKDDRTTKNWLNQLLRNIETKMDGGPGMAGTSLSPGPGTANAAAVSVAGAPSGLLSSQSAPQLQSSGGSSGNSGTVAGGGGSGLVQQQQPTTLLKPNKM